MPEQRPTDPRHLRVIYQQGGQLWVWCEETGQAKALVSNAERSSLSPDGSRIAFTRPLGPQREEIWIAQSDGSGERAVAVSDGQEAAQRNPQASDILLELGWLPNSRVLWFSRTPRYELPAKWPHEDLYLVDTDSGSQRLILPAGQAIAATFSPDGHCLAVLAKDELRLIDTGSGCTLQAVSLPKPAYPVSPQYAPDGRNLLVYLEGSVAVTDGGSGGCREIPLQYALYRLPHALVPPQLFWTGLGSEVYAVISDGLDPQAILSPGATFTLWRLDFAQGTARRLRTLVGNSQRVDLSADGRWLLYVRNTSERGQEGLCLVDLESGREAQLARGRQPITLLGWHPGALRYVYAFAGLQPAMVGGLCGPAEAVGGLANQEDIHVSQFQWVRGRDAFLMCGQVLGQGAVVITVNTLDGDSRLVARVQGDAYCVGHFLVD